MFGLIKKLFGADGSVPRARPIKPEPIAFDELRHLLIANELTSVWLTPTDLPGFSKLGGSPDIDDHADWPTNEIGEPMAFVAQLDLAAIMEADGPDWLPEIGVLYFFAETQSINPFTGGRVLYRAQHSARHRTDAPPGARVFKERHLGMEAHPSYPSGDWLNVTGRCRDLDDEQCEALDELMPGRSDEDADHRCAGYPGEVQDGYFALHCELMARGEYESIDRIFKDPVALDAINSDAIRHWRLLLQIDSDDSIGMEWVDAGRIYYFIREEDARAGDFSRVQFQIQFH